MRPAQHLDCAEDKLPYRLHFPSTLIYMKEKRFHKSAVVISLAWVRDLHTQSFFFQRNLLFSRSIRKSVANLFGCVDLHWLIMAQLFIWQTANFMLSLCKSLIHSPDDNVYIAFADTKRTNQRSRTHGVTVGAADPMLRQMRLLLVTKSMRLNAVWSQSSVTNVRHSQFDE